MSVSGRLRSRAEAFVAQPRPSRRARIATTTICALAVVALGFLDRATGVGLSFAAFYVMPAAIAAILVGTSVGLAIAAQSAIAWGIAEALITPDEDPLVLRLGNGMVRFVILSTVVVLLASLRRSLERVQASDRHSREFVAFAAHQLRTPVASVQATAEALLVGEGANRERLLSNLAGEAARMGRLVRSLLRIVRIDQGEASDPTLGSLVEVIRSEIDRFSHISAVPIILEPPTAGLDEVRVSNVDVGEILGNLLDNARRHASTAVHVKATLSGDQVSVAVRDDGPGLLPGTEERVFDRFVTLDHFGGSGLGLSIARELARRHGGDVRYAAGGFVLALPTARDQS